MKSTNLHRRLAAVLLALCLTVCCAMPALATSANFQPSRKGALHITLYDHQNDVPLRGGEITLYQVAAVQRTNGNLRYTYTGDFVGCGVALGDLSDSTLADRLLKYLPATAEGTARNVNEEGEVDFEKLPLGLYLVVQTEASHGYAAINPFVVSVPMKDGKNWVYEVDASPKVGATTPEEPDEPDTPDKPDVPDTPDTPDTPDNPDTPVTPDNPDVPVSPGNPDTPVSPGNPDTPVSPGNPDTPVSPGTPDTPVLPGNPDTPVNPGSPDTPVSPGVPDKPVLPQTGQLNWPIPLLACSGVLLFAAGWVLNRQGKKED